ncbi:MAG: (2Fe-2S)-binding protein [Firmicutes bacterium]|nr:(2Fe-2S)-binding protein [Bacillota bacterium]
MANVSITLSVNGREYTLAVAPDLRLIVLLRDHLHLMGTKEGCGKGECGSCTVIMDGLTVTSCLVLAVQADGAKITTIEGLGGKEALDPLQESFIRHGAVQCGYCIPGMVLSAKQLLDANPNPSRDEIKQGLAGNLCRCTGYTKILDAVEAVARGGGKR